jgi:alkanesulfonate monooxygenase SsuD/methylene tetrahydromethanopterin reductase-like flavin-dependent oxidoreductase (luciferase family)
MIIGIGLPASVPGTKGTDLVDWARRADQGPFSSLGIIDRLVYPNYEPLITLAAAAGATKRIRLMTTILLAPLRNSVLFAKQAASLDAISGGRLTLGLGIGARQDDFLAVQVPFKKRARIFEQQIEQMKLIWSGRPLSDSVGPIGPMPVQPGGPELLIGGYNPTALQRGGRLGDGFISGGGGDPARLKQSFQIFEKAWQDAGRTGQPRFVACFYVAVGQELAGRASEYIHNYYGRSNPMSDGIAQSIPFSPKAIQEKIRIVADSGADEIMLWSTVADLDQVDRLAEIVGQI